MISSLELARLCGVSQGTVDRALHDRPGVSAVTKARILEVAEQYGYVPHPATQELLSGESPLVGAIIPATNSPFFMDLMQSAHIVCRSHGLQLLIAPAAGREEFIETLTEFAARRFRAALVVPPEEGINLPRSVSETFPVAALLEGLEGKSTRLFAPDEVDTGRRATEFLIELGHRQIMHMTYSRSSKAIRERAQGYCLTMQAHNLQPVVCIADPPMSFIKDITDYQPTAIFCHNDWQALGIIRSVSDLGMRVPEDLSVVGVDDSPTFTSLFPGITTLRYPFSEVVESALTWLLQGIEPKKLPVTTVVQRTSTCRYPGNG